jgi:hypothetical protein
VAFWHTLAQVLIPLLIVLFSLPAAITAGYFRNEVLNGQLDILSTIPLLKTYHSALAWCICAWIWILFLYMTCWVFFSLTLVHTSAVVVAVHLALSGACLGLKCTYMYVYTYLNAIAYVCL